MSFQTINPATGEFVKEFLLHTEQRRALGCFLAVRRVQHSAGRAPALTGLRQDPARRPALPEDRTSRTTDFGGAGGRCSVGTWS
ncbi:hypothetical protein ACFVDQ_32035 [Streptomyces sp. NPDC057684]|uniref:hypothetical protein n=1 Tax=unclassified Streptomyces TaxID=2593676 RepID=UPI00367D5496